MFEARAMKLKGVLIISAIYVGLLGIGFMLVPRQIGSDAVPADASPELIASLRIFGGPILGIAVLNWITRNAEPSTARNGVVLGNSWVCVCHCNKCMGSIHWWRTPAAKLFLVMHLTVAFVVAGRASTRAQGG